MKRWMTRPISTIDTGQSYNPTPWQGLTVRAEGGYAAGPSISHRLLCIRDGAGFPWADGVAPRLLTSSNLLKSVVHTVVVHAPV